jgi:hypothetical protein
MRVIEIVVGLCSMAVVTGCNSSGGGQVRDALKTAFDRAGCPVEVQGDGNVSCASTLNPKPDDACRDPGKKIAWQAVDDTPQRNPIALEFSVRFKAAEQVLEDDYWWPAKCSTSKRTGLLECKVKKGKPAVSGHWYKYVIEVDNTECPLLDPRVWVK